MALRQVPDAGRFGVVDLAPRRPRARRSGSVPTARDQASSTAAFTGWTATSCSARSRRAARRRSSARRCRRSPRRGLLAGRAYGGTFIDIGVADELERAQGLFPVRRGAVFFDRDGTLNHDRGIPTGSTASAGSRARTEAIRAVNDAGLFAFVVSNQSGVARGLYAEAGVLALHGWMTERLRDSGAHIDAFSFCPHHPEGHGAGLPPALPAPETGPRHDRGPAARPGRSIRCGASSSATARTISRPPPRRDCAAPFSVAGVSTRSSHAPPPTCSGPECDRDVTHMGPRRSAASPASRLPDNRNDGVDMRAITLGGASCQIEPSQAAGSPFRRGA